MANITPGAARLGYQVFLSANGSLTRGQVQDELDQLGLGLLSDRMYKHYRSLFEAGYDHYVTVNRFDILRAAEPFGVESGKSRYAYVEIEAALRVTALRQQPFTFLAVASKVSDAGASLSVNADIGKRLSKGDQRLRPGDHLRLDFIEESRSVDAKIIDRPELQANARTWFLEVEFSRLRSIAEFTSASELQSELWPVRLVADDGGPIAADVLARRLFHLLEAVENTRTIFNDLADGDPILHARVSPARISHLRMDSPLEVTLVVPVGLLTVVGFVWYAVKHLPVAYKTVQEGRLLGAQVRTEEARAEAIELSNSETKALLPARVEHELRLLGATAPTVLNQRRFDSTVDQLLDNIDALEREGVLGLELPAQASRPQVGALNDDEPSE